MTEMSLQELLGQVKHLAADALDYRSLLGRALEVMESAYACPEWVASGRTEGTDETLALVRRALKLEKKNA